MTNARQELHDSCSQKVAWGLGAEDHFGKPSMVAATQGAVHMRLGAGGHVSSARGVEAPRTSECSVPSRVSRGRCVSTRQPCVSCCYNYPSDRRQVKPIDFISCSGLSKQRESTNVTQNICLFVTKIRRDSLESFQAYFPKSPQTTQVKALTHCFVLYVRLQHLVVSVFFSSLSKSDTYNSTLCEFLALSFNLTKEHLLPP